MTATAESQHGPANHFDMPGCPAEIHKQPPPSLPFRFLDLPGELQNVVVNDFIVSESPIVIRLPQFNRQPSPPPTPVSHPRLDKLVVLTPPASRSPSKERDRECGHSRLAIMLTCKQLYREHWRTYYADNTFVFNMDVFREYAQSMPSRCWQHIRKVAFRMPHRHHHEGIWKMLATMKWLIKLQLWLPDYVKTDETVREAAIQGIKECKRLKSCIIRRISDTDDKHQDLDENDQELQDKISTLLDPGHHTNSVKKRKPPKLERKLTDPFTSNPPEVADSAA